jgi:hypothetical protein
MNMRTSAEEARSRFTEGVDLTIKDGRFGLKYVLLRLRHAGLTDQDRANLGDLVAIACRDQDVTEAADRVRKAEAASPLAVAIADIVENAQNHRKAAALGAIFGAHGAVFPSRDERDPVAEAVAGAIAACSITLLDDQRLGIDLDEFLVLDIENPGRE